MSSKENSLVGSSKENRENTKKKSKFTRGEKCIFVHLVVTFVAILALVLVYVGHLLAAPHAGTELRLAGTCSPRRDAPAACRLPERASALTTDCLSAETIPVHINKSVVGAGHYDARDFHALEVAAVLRDGRVGRATWASLAGAAGAVGVRGRRACGGVRVRPRWAVAPAHCVAARAHPLLATDLPHWKISYRLHGDYIESDIVRGVVHSYFNRDDFSNNIGLFEQADPIYMDDYKPSTGVVEEELQRHATEGDASVVRWEDGAAAVLERPTELPVNTIPSQLCRQYMAPVVELRTYEFCVHMHKKNLTIEHGAAVVFGSEIKGFVAWGDQSGALPLVVLDIGLYGKWIENIVHVYKY